MEIAPPIAPLYGDLVARIVAAQCGRSVNVSSWISTTRFGAASSAKTARGDGAWPGSAAGEAFVAFQEYVQQRSRREIILAVSSKNDETVA